MKGHTCDNCEYYLNDSDYTSYGSWSYTCHTCGFTYRHGASPVQEQVDKFKTGKYFLTVDWCNKGRRGVFCKSDGDAFWKANEPHTKDEMFDILGVFDLVLAPQSLLITEDELKTYNKWLPLAEYSNIYGYAYKS